MTNSHLYRIGGICLRIGAIAFVVHIALRSVLTAGADPSAVPLHGLWVPTNALGVFGAVLVLLGLAGTYVRIATSAGPLGLAGVGMIAAAWLFFGVFLSLYSVLVLPWLAERAPSLLASSAPLPAEFVVAFIAALLAWFFGASLLAIPFSRGRLEPRWVGYLLLASALWMVVGNLLLAPSGPATDLTINLLSNLGPVLLLVALGRLGSQAWPERDPAGRFGSSMWHPPG